MNKICSCCGEVKFVEEFNKKKGPKDGLQHWCKTCNRERSRRYYAENREKHRALVRVKTKERKEELKQKVHAMKAEAGCLLCEERDPACLDFHHPNSDKEVSIATAISERWCWDRIEAEIRKCVVLCSNHHRKLHAGRFTLEVEITTPRRDRT